MKFKLKSCNAIQSTSHFAFRTSHFAFTYGFLFVYVARFFRRYSCGNGDGRRNSHYSSFGFDRRSGAKNCAVRQFVCLSANEPFCIKNACEKRFIGDKRNVVGDCACAAPFGGRDDSCRRATVRAFEKGVRDIFNFSCCGRTPKCAEKKRLTNARIRVKI